jgi:hypothetical protein
MNLATPETRMAARELRPCLWIAPTMRGGDAGGEGFQVSRSASEASGIRPTASR